MNEEVHLYSAYFSNNTVPFKFEISEMPIKNVHKDGTIENKLPYFTDTQYSTYYFEGLRMNLGEEHQLTFGKVYYSTNKEKCHEWLKKKYESEREKILKAYDAIENAKIIDKGVDKYE